MSQKKSDYALNDSNGRYSLIAAGVCACGIAAVLSIEPIEAVWQDHCHLSGQHR